MKLIVSHFGRGCMSPIPLPIKSSYKVDLVNELIVRHRVP